MLYCLVRLNKKYQWEPVYTEPAHGMALQENYLTDDKDWIQKFKHDMSMAYPTELYEIAEVHLPSVYNMFKSEV